MDEPLRSRHRTAHTGGLTSPDPVPHPHGPRPPANASHDPAKDQDKPPNGERREKHARRHPQDQFLRPASGKRSPEFTRWIEA
jgi:hypothetical protein